ncbi:MAG: T9SS type A sorting domain-containing protein [Bacteroidota bacterium]
MKRLTLALLLWAALSPSFAQQFDWQFAGKLSGSDVEKVFVDQGTVYVVAKGGLFALEEGAQDWKNLTESIAGGETYDAEIDSEGNFWVAIDGVGVYKSANGRQWERMGETESFESVGTLSLAINRAGHLFVGNNKGISRSKDGGLTWENIGDELGEKKVRDLLVGQEDEIYAFASLSGVYRSTDGGDSWQIRDNGLPTPLSLLFANFEQADDGTIYFSASNHGVYKSTNKGESWAQLPLPQQTVTTVASSTNDSDLYVSVNDRLWHSSDGGDGWTERQLDASILYVYRIFAQDNGQVYVSSCEDLWYSSDRGQTFSKSNGRQDGNIFGLLTDGDRTIYAATCRRLFRSQDDGQNWTELKNDTEARFTSLMWISPDGSLYNQAFTKDSDRKLLRSDDVGESWTVIGEELGETPFLTKFIPSENGIIFTMVQVNGKIFHSADYGTTWQEIPQPSAISRVDDIGLDSKGNLYVTGRNNFLYSSNDLGQNWRVVTRNSNVWEASQLFIGPDDELILIGIDKTFFISRNGGNTWSTSTEVRFGGEMLFSKTGDWYYTIESRDLIALYRSKDEGLTWEKVSDFDKYVIRGGIRELGAGEFLIATRTNGVLRNFETIFTSQQEIDRQAKRASLQANRPNPFHTQTEIAFQLTKAAHIQLKIFDALGREVSTIANERYAAGPHSLSWEASDREAGLYFYSLFENGRQVASRKMLLLR